MVEKGKESRKGGNVVRMEKKKEGGSMGTRVGGEHGK